MWVGWRSDHILWVVNAEFLVIPKGCMNVFLQLYMCDCLVYFCQLKYISLISVIGPLFPYIWLILFISTISLNYGYISFPSKQAACRIEEACIFSTPATLLYRAILKVMLLSLLFKSWWKLWWFSCPYMSSAAWSVEPRSIPLKCKLLQTYMCLK